jgi:hypothetical protein
MAKNETEVTYDVYKVADISIAMSTSAKSDKLEDNVKKNAGLVWGHTVCTVMERIDTSAFQRDTSKEGIAAIGDFIKAVVSSHILATQTIPEKGKNRQGKEFNVSEKDGTIKWGSWDQTRRIWAYIGDISKIIAYGLESELYPTALTVGSRGTLLAKCKTPEGHMAAIERLSGQLQDNLDMVADSKEVHTAHLRVAGLCINNLDPVDEMRELISRLDALLGVVSQPERQAVLKDIGRLSTHFTA